MSDVITWKYEPQEGNEVACVTEYYDGRLIRFVCEFATDPTPEDGALMASAPSLRDEIESLRAQLSEAQARLALHDEIAVALSRLAYALHGKGDRRGVLHDVPAALEKADAVLAKMDSTAAPVAPAAQDAGDWRIAASAWLKKKADKQAAINKAHPRYVECYPEWEQAERALRWYASEVLTTQFSAPVQAAQVAQCAQPVSDAYKYAGQPVADDVVRNDARYRFLRDCVSNTDSPQSLVLDELMGQIDEMVGMEYSDALDAAIDAAMLAAQRQQKDGGGA